MGLKGIFFRRLWLALCPLIAVSTLIFFGDGLQLMLSPFSEVSFTMLIFIIFLVFSVVWSFLYHAIIDIFFLLKWILTGFKKDENIKDEIVIGLERVRLQLNDINKVSPEELENYAKRDFVHQEIDRVKNKFIHLYDKINDLEVGVSKGKITSLPNPKRKLSKDLGGWVDPNL